MPVVHINYINKLTAYKYKKVISEDSLPDFDLPSNWQQTANQLLPGIDEHFRLDRSYHSRDNLLKSAKFFTAILLDKVTIPDVVIDNHLKQLIQEKFKEGIPHCTEGLHGRINALYGLFFVPKTIDELLQRVRQGILDIGAYNHRHDDRGRNQNGEHDVNVVNYIVLQAAKQGYGTQVANVNDNYGRLFIDESIAIQAVHTIFKEKYTPLNILFLLTQELNALLSSNFAYRGRLEEEGYDIGDYSAFKNYINQLLDGNFSDQEILVFDEDYLNVIDINWPLINQQLWAKAKKCFSFPDLQLNAFNFLYQTSNINSSESINHFKNIIKLFSDFNDHQIIMSLFTDLNNQNKVELLGYLFKINPSIFTEKNVIKLIDSNKNNLDYINGLRLKLNQLHPNYPLKFELELTTTSSCHPLVSYFNYGDTQISDLFAKLKIIAPQKQVEIFSSVLNGDEGVLQSIMKFDFRFRHQSIDKLSAIQKKQRANYQSLPRIFSLLDSFSKEQLEMFFYCNNFIEVALSFNRHCLLAILKLLHNVGPGVIQHCLSLNDAKASSSLYFLLNLNGELDRDHNDLFNAPLDKEQVGCVIDSTLAILSKLPAEIRQTSIEQLFISQDHFLLHLYSSSLTQSQTKALLSIASKSLLKQHIEALPEIKNTVLSVSENLNKTRYLLSVLPLDNGFDLLQKKIEKNGIVKLSKSSLAREMFFSKESAVMIHDVFKKITDAQRYEISPLILEKKEDLSKWLSKMEGSVGVNIFYEIISFMPIEFRRSVLDYSISNNKRHDYSNILYLMTHLKLNDSASLLDMKIGVWGFRKHFYQKVLNEQDCHKPLLTYLKSVEDEAEKTKIQKIVFQDGIDFVVNVLMHRDSNRATVELAFESPNDVKIQAINNYLESGHFSVESIANLLAITKTLVLDDLLNVYLTKIAGENKSLFQIIIETKPFSIYILNKMLKAGGFNTESFINLAIRYPLQFSDKVETNLAGSFYDVLTLLDFFPKDKYFSIFNELADLMRTKDDVIFYLNILCQASGNQIRQTLMHSSGTHKLKSLESMAIQVNYKEMLDESLIFLLENMEIYQNTPINFFNINNIPFDINKDQEKIKSVFRFSLSLSRLQKKLAIAWWKKFKGDLSFKLNLLIDNITLFSVEEVEQLFAFDNTHHNSVLHHYIVNGGELKDNLWLHFLNKLSDDKFYALLADEIYATHNIAATTILNYLSQQNFNNFFMVYDWIQKRQRSEQKDAFLNSNTLIPNDVLVSLLQSGETNFSAYIKFSYSIPITKVRQHFIAVLNRNYLGSKVKLLMHGFMRNIGGAKLLSNVLLTRNNDNKPLFIEVLEKNLSLMEPCLASLTYCSDEQQFDLLSNSISGYFNLYCYLFKKSHYFSWTSSRSSLNDSQKILIRHIISMPVKHWQSCSSSDVEFFYHLIALNHDRCLAKYFIEASDRLLNNIVSDERFQLASGRLILNELAIDESDFYIDFLKTLTAKLNQENIKKVFGMQNFSGDTFALCTLIQGRETLPEFINALSLLDPKDQKKILLDCYKNGKSNIKQDIQLWVDLKLQLLDLEASAERFTLGIIKTDNDRTVSRVIKKLSDGLTKAYHAALSSDEHSKKEAFSQLNILLSDEKTREVLNTHRGIKKIVVNILAAIAGLGLGYLLACGVNLYITNGKHFFFHPQTNTDKLADEILLNIDKVASA